MNNFLHLLRPNRVLEPLCFALAICFTLPLTVFYYNINEFSNILPSLLWTSTVSFFIVCLPLLLLTFVGPKTQKAISFLCLTTCAYILLITFALPIQSGLQDGTDPMENMTYILGINTEYIVFISLIAGVVLAYLWKTSLLRDAVFFASAFTVLWIGYVTYIGFESDWKLAQTQVGENKEFRLSKNKNIIIISFDSLQGDVLNEIFDESQEYPELFDGFTYFRDVAGVAHDTVLSLRTTSIGHLPEFSNKDFINETKTNTFIHDLTQAGFDASLYTVWGSVRVDCLHQAVNSAFAVEKLNLNLSSLYEAVLARIIPYQMQKGFTAIQRNFATTFTTNSPNELVDILTQNHGSSLVTFKLGILDFRDFFDTVKVDDGPNVLLFHHYLFTHDPVDFDRACKIRRPRDVEQDYSNNKDLFICGVSELASLIQKLKDIGVYDNSLIIFTSDHGAQCRYQDSPYQLANGEVYSPGETGGTRWCPGRWNPFLMIKDFGARGEMIFSDKKVSLIDIAATACTAGISADFCKERGYEGYNLTAPIPSDRIRPVLLNTSSYTDRRDYTDAVKVEIEGNVWSGLQKKFKEVTEDPAHAEEKAEFNYLAYMAAHKGLTRHFGHLKEPFRQQAVEAHYYNHGIPERRFIMPKKVQPLNEGLPQDFHHLLYLVVNDDLLKKYFSLPEPKRQNVLEKHYLAYGRKENRPYRP